MKKLTQEEFIERSINFHNNKYDYSLVNYINSYTKVKITCPNHGIFEQSPSDHMRFGCSFCSKKLNATKVKKTTKDEFISKAKEIHNNLYDYSLVNYINTETKVEIICRIHGSFLQSPHHHLNGVKCPNCSFNKKLNTQTFIEKAKDVHNDLYIYDNVKFIHCKSKVKIECKKHGIFNQTASDHLSGCGCPICKESKGEKQIRNFLKENNIKYISQMTFYDCQYKSNLFFDFFIPYKNLCIEFDGEQHFNPIDYFGGIKNFKKIEIRDKIKNEYCQNNSIHLIRIRYDENVENILNSQFQFI